MKFFIRTISLLLVLKLHSQIFDDSTFDFIFKKHKHLVFYEGQGSSLSNFMPFKLQKSLLSEKLINKKTLGNTSFKKNNYYLFTLNNSINFFYKLDSIFSNDKFGLHFSFGRQQFLSATANKHTAKLLLYGNKELAGEDFALNFQFINYDNFYLTAGVFKIQNYYDHLNLFASFDINFHYLQKIQYLRIYDGRFYTSEDGTFILTKIKGEYSDNLSKKNKAYGISFNGELFANYNKDYVFSLSFKNAGFFKLNKKSLYASVDTCIIYEGAIIDFATTDLTVNFPFNINTLKDKIIDTTSSVVFIPLFYNLKFGKFYNNKRLKSTFLEIKYYSLINQRIPSIGIDQKFKINSHISIATQIEYSTFSRLMGGLALKYKYKNFIVDTLLKFPLNYIIVSNYFGMCLFINAGYKF